LKERQTGREDDEEDISNCRKRGDTGNWKRKHYIANRGELALVEAMDLS